MYWHLLRKPAEINVNFPSLLSHFVESTTINVLPKFSRYKNGQGINFKQLNNARADMANIMYILNYIRTKGNIWSEQFWMIKDVIVTSLDSNEIYEDNTCKFTMLWYQLHQL
jgi:hypothetical protein